MPSLGLGLGLDKSQGVILAPEAVSWAAAVVAAGSSAPASVVFAVSEFVKGCQADPSPNSGVSNWDAMEVVQLLAGPDTFAGIAVPLAGATPTFFNFVSGDYDPATGLKGDGLTRYVFSGLTISSSSSLTNFGAGVYVTELPSFDAPMAYFGGGVGQSGSVNAGTSSTELFVRNRTATGATFPGEQDALGYIGTSRSNAEGYEFYFKDGGHEVTQASASTGTRQLLIFARDSGGPTTWSDARISFYFFGGAVSQSSLNARLKTLMSAIAAAHQ